MSVHRARHVSALFALFAVVAGACSGGGSDEPAVAALPTAASTAHDAEPLDADVTLAQLCRDRFAGIEATDELHVGLMTDAGSIIDGNFNQSAYEGMQAAARCFGFGTTYLASGETGDYAAHLRDLVEQDVDAVITVGYPLTGATATVAAEHPEVAFIGIDQVVDAGTDNHVRVTYADAQAGYLAGVMAALITNRSTVGVVAGPDDVPPVVALADGFEWGVRSVAPDLTVKRAHLPSFSDPEAGSEKVSEFLRAGVGAVFAPAGMTGSGAILHAAQAGIPVIGVDRDQYLTTFEGGLVAGSNRIATSVVKRVDLGVFLQLADLVQGTFTGGAVVLDAASGGVTYAPSHDFQLPPGVAERIEEVRRGLASGTIDPGVPAGRVATSDG